MELKAFLAELTSSLAQLHFVTSIDLRTEAFILSRRVVFSERGFLEIYFNERTQTVALAWVEDARRKWGIDRDQLRDWHRHPSDNPQDHQMIGPPSVADMIQELDTVWHAEKK